MRWKADLMPHNADFLDKRFQRKANMPLIGAVTIASRSSALTIREGQEDRFPSRSVRGRYLGVNVDQGEGSLSLNDLQMARS